MANNPYVNKVVYGGTTLIDISDTTATAETILEGYTAYGANGQKLTGTASGQSLIVTDTIDEHGGTIRTITGKVVQLQTKTITPTSSQQVVNPDTGYDGFSQVTVNASSGTEINNQNKTVSPTESQQSVTADSGYTGLGTVTVNAISSTYVGTGVARKSSTDLTTSGATVTVPAGYYSEAASKAVASGSAGTPTASKGTVSNHSISVTPSVTNTTGYISGGTKTGTAVTVSASELVSGTLTIDSSGTKDVTNYASASVASGSAKPASSISGSSATVSTGTNTLTLTKTISNTPQVTAGYISAGTAGNSSVSLTASVTTKAAATITPGTSNQQISSGVYLTGTQTIAGDANLVGSNIISGKSIFGVAGSVVINKYYTGSSAPSSSLGSDGDIYFKTN